MLLTLLILQVLLVQVLNQTHQGLKAQFAPLAHDLPVHPEQSVLACLQGACEPGTESFELQWITQTSERQFFNAELRLCEDGLCYQITQVFSESSAILKGDRIFHAITVEATLET